MPVDHEEFRNRMHILQKEIASTNDVTDLTDITDTDVSRSLANQLEYWTLQFADNHPELTSYRFGGTDAEQRLQFHLGMLFAQMLALTMAAEAGATGHACIGCAGELAIKLLRAQIEMAQAAVIR